MASLVGAGDVALLLRRVLPLPWMIRLARLHGALLYWLSPSRRQAVARNLAPFAGSERELRTMARRVFEYRQIRVMMLLLFLETEPAEREGWIAIAGVEHLDRAVAGGRGAILLGSHLNSLGIFMATANLRHRGYDIRVALPSDAELFPLTRVGTWLRRNAVRPTLKDELGAFFVRFNVRPIVKALAENAIVGQTGDGWHSANFVRVPFLGRSVPFTTGMMSVARSTGATVVPCNVVGAPPALRCVIAPGFQVANTDDSAGDIAEAVERYATAFEQTLRDNILCWEHWLVPDALATMETWPDRPINERLEV